MELKRTMSISVTQHKVEGFNRTFMELKHFEILRCRGLRVRFNRTFMELKQRLGVPEWRSKEGFNRTFMELKLVLLYVLESVYNMF